MEAGKIIRSEIAVSEQVQVLTDSFATAALLAAYSGNRMDGVPESFVTPPSADTQEPEHP